MKKIIISLVALFTLTATFSQVEFGIQVSPTISTSRLEATTTSFNYDKYKSGLRFTAGPVVDIFLKDNIAISTGLWYAAKRSGVEVKDSADASKSLYTTYINGQYLQVPVGFKFYTQEITAGLKLYANLGGTLDFKVGEKIFINDKTDAAIQENHTSFFDSGLLIGLGAEMKIGDHNKVFGGFTYSRGLVNTLAKEKDHNKAINKNNLKLNSDLYGFMIGYKF